MKYDEIETLLQYNEKESKIFIPNEIFDDLKKTAKNTPHLAFTYSYYYLISWLYRYTKYGLFQLDTGQIKEILGYNQTTKGLDYITKKNGLTDQIGYTQTVKDFPISWSFDDNMLEFELLSDMDKFTQQIIKENLNRKYTVKFPIKAFYRYPDDDELKEEYDNGYEDGTFFDISNTHCIPFEIFMYCMENESIGTIGFYLYSYIKRMNDKYASGWDVSIENMSEQTGIAEKTLIRYLDQLRKYKMIEAIHNQEYFCIALDMSKRKANTYYINEFDLFTDKPQQYKKMKVLTTKEHYEKLDGEFERLLGNPVDISESELPY